MIRFFVAGALACALTVSADVVEWEFPRLGSCHEGIPFSDGRTGVLVWGGSNTVHLTVGRGDLWDHRGGYPWLACQSYTNIVAAVASGDAGRLMGLFKKETPKGEPRNPYMLPLGRVVLKLSGNATLTRGTLDPFTGLGRLFLSDGQAIELAMSKKSRAFALRLPEGIDAEIKSIPATEFPVYEQALASMGFAKAKGKGDFRFVDSSNDRLGGFRWKLPADEPVWLTWGRNGRDVALKTGRGDKVVAEGAARFDTVATESTEHWAAFWRTGARVKVPDPVVQQIFNLGMYKFGAMTDPDGFAAGLQGQWLEDDRLVPWNGDYHFNINIQECYSPAFRGGHFDHLMPLFRMVLSWRDLLRDNARKFVQIDDGYVLPHSVDDRGVCIGGFWTGTIDHASTAWIASLMYRYVRYSGDVAFLKTAAYDFMKGAMNVYLAMMEERDGKLSIPLGPSPEWGAADVRKAVGRDPSFQLAAAHRLARDLVAAAELLGESPDERWLDLQKRLPAYTQGEGGIQLFEGQPFVSSHRHHSHLAGLYPFDTIPMTHGPDLKVVRESYRTWIYKGTGEWSGWCVPWASILHTHMGHAEAAVHALHSWKTFYNNPGHGSLHDAFRPGYTVFLSSPTVMQMDGQCAAVTAVMELMAHEINGEVKFFRGCPESWKTVSFENLALSDGTRVDGRRIDGKVTVMRKEDIR